VKVFVVHRFADEKQAKRNLKLLAEKHSLNIDFVFLRVNERKWRQSAEKAVEESEAIIVYDVGACGQSGNAAWEIELAKAKNKIIIEIECFENDESRTAIRLHELLNNKFENCFLAKQDGENQNSLELYKLMVESSENLLQRRQNISSFYSATIGTLIAIVGVLFETKLLEGNAILVLYGLFVIGLLLCRSWRSLLQNYGKLNSAKFDVILRLEKELDARIFSAEWIAMNKKKYKPFTKTEMNVPIFFMVLIGALTVALTVWYFHEAILVALASFL